MVKKILELVLLMCFTGGLLYAGEVALVTDINGEVSASWLEPVADGVENADGERGRHEWQVELAEMLPAGADIKTGEKSAVTLVHLAGNVEYTLGANALARITEDGVEGETVASTPMQLVSTDIDLDGTMQNQVGAVVADHEHQQTIGNADMYDRLRGSQVSDVNKSVDFIKSDNFDSGVDREQKSKKLELDDLAQQELQEAQQALQEAQQAVEQAQQAQQAARQIDPQPAPPPAAAPAPVQLANPVDSSASTAGMTPPTEVGGSSDEFAKHAGVSEDEEMAEPDLPAASAKEQSLPGETGFALPEEMLVEVRSANDKLSIEGYEITINADYEGWVNIRFVAQVTDRDFELLLKGDKASRTIVMHVEKDSKPSIALAWRLEKSGLLAQAASEWLQLQAGGMSAVKVALHLKRIRNKLLEE